MPSHVVIIKTDGTETNPMPQRQAEIYLGKLITANRTASLKQAMNDVYSGKGKATGAYMYAGLGGSHRVLHASSGNGQTSVSLFYVTCPQGTFIIAMGEHLDVPKPKVEYKLTDYGQPSGSFKRNATIKLN